MKEQTDKLGLSPQDAALAALVLAHHLGAYDAASLSLHIASAPAFDNEADARLEFIAPLIRDMAAAPEGFEAVLDVIAAAVTQPQAPTVYALSADYIAVHGAATPEEIRFLERLGEALQIGRLTRAALDSAALARAGDLT